jgi:hypothetical protein
LQLTTTTKIFIILVCLFAFLFTPMAIQFAARTNDWRRLATDYQDQAETDAAAAQSMRAQLAGEQAAMALEYRQFQAALADAIRLRNDLMQQIAALTSQRDQLALEAKGMQTANELQAGGVAVITKHNEELVKTNKDLAKSELELQTRNAELLTQLKDLNAQLVVLRQELAKQQQQLAQCRDENENFRRSQGIGRAGDRDVVGPPPPARAESPPLTGRVTGRVKTVQGNLATIDVGSSSGLREGVKIVVLRGDSYVCDLVITSEISPNEAVGEVVVGTAQSRQIRPGDEIMDEVTFNSRG